MKMNWFRYMVMGVATVLLGGSVAYLSKPSLAATPGIISYQGRVVVNGAPFTGAGLFRFALVNSAGSTTYWSNDNSSSNGSEPTASVSLTVANGLYSILLGDTTVTGITTEIPESVFGNADVRLRIWFNDGANGSKLLTPDQRIVATGYALIAKSVDALSVTEGMLAADAVTTSKIKDGAVTSSKIAPLPKASYELASSQLISNSGVPKKVLLTNKVFEEGGQIVTSGEFSAPEAGTYLVIATVFWEANGTGTRTVALQANGASNYFASAEDKANTDSTMTQNVSGIVNLNQSQVVDLLVHQDSGTDISILPVAGSRPHITKMSICKLR